MTPSQILPVRQVAHVNEIVESSWHLNISVLDAKIEGKMIQILVNQNGDEETVYEAFWMNKTAKLYLSGTGTSLSYRKTPLLFYVHLDFLCTSKKFEIIISTRPETIYMREGREIGLKTLVLHESTEREIGRIRRDRKEGRVWA